MARNTDLAEVVRFHGHLCPGLAIGYRMTKAAMAALGAGRAEDEELVATIENDSCSADAVQWLTGCTFGKGNLIFRDYGKQVLTLAWRPSGRAVRVALRAVEAPAGLDRQERVQWLLEAPPEELLDVRPVVIALPHVARIQPTVMCDRCGELVMATRVVEQDGEQLCRPCAEEREA